jgi:hypothetical protein
MGTLLAEAISGLACGGNVWTWIATLIACLPSRQRSPSGHRWGDERQPRRLADIYADVANEVPARAFIEVWMRLGISLNLNPGVIDPTDTSASLRAITPDGFDAGCAAFTQWLAEKNLGPPLHTETVLDVAKRVAQFE